MISKKKLSLLNEDEEGIDIIIHVADIFISLTFVAIATSYILFEIKDDSQNLHGIILLLISIVFGLVLYYVFEYLTSLISSSIIRNSSRPFALTLPYLFIVFISFPFRKLFEKGLKHDRIIKRNAMTFSELSDVIEHSQTKPEEESEKELIKGILNFSDLVVSEIMKSRVDVVAFDSTDVFSEILKTIVDSGYSRYPVYNDNLDNICGILNIKDLLPHIRENDDFNWKNLVRTAYFVPENQMISELLKEFQKSKNHIAVVVDEYGGTSGLVTLEDILEEIVGEIDDEFDNESDGLNFEKISDQEYVFDGKTTLNDFCKITKISYERFDDIKTDAETLAGIILAIVGKFPETNQNVTFGNILFTIESMDARRIKLIRVTITPENNEN